MEGAHKYVFARTCRTHFQPIVDVQALASFYPAPLAAASLD